MGFLDLFRPAWKSKDNDKVLNAVEKLTDNKKLKYVVEKYTNGYNYDCNRIIAAAMYNITDQTFLAEIVNGSNYTDCRGRVRIRWANIANITDENILYTMLANYGICHKLHMSQITEIVDKLSDNSLFRVLQEFSRAMFDNNNDHQIAILLSQKLGNRQRELFEICCLSDNTVDDRKKAFNEIKEEEEFENIVGIARDRHYGGPRYSAISELALLAIEKIKKQEFLVGIVLSIRYNNSIDNIPHDYTKLIFIALQKITDEGLLFRIAKEGHEEFGAAAVARITDKNKLEELSKHIRIDSYYPDDESDRVTETYDAVAKAASYRLKELGY
jgi:hypothetical protein